MVTIISVLITLSSTLEMGAPVCVGLLVVFEEPGFGPVLLITLREAGVGLVLLRVLTSEGPGVGLVLLLTFEEPGVCLVLLLTFKKSRVCLVLLLTVEEQAVGLVMLVILGLVSDDFAVVGCNRIGPCCRIFRFEYRVHKMAA